MLHMTTIFGSHGWLASHLKKTAGRNMQNLPLKLLTLKEELKKLKNQSKAYSKPRNADFIPYPFAADHLTTVSLSFKPERSFSDKIQELSILKQISLSSECKIDYCPTNEYENILLQQWETLSNELLHSWISFNKSLNRNLHVWKPNGFCCISLQITYRQCCRSHNYSKRSNG